MYIYIYIFICLYIDIYMFICSITRKTHTHAQIHIHTHTHTHINTHTHIQTNKHFSVLMCASLSLSHTHLPQGAHGNSNPEQRAGRAESFWVRARSAVAWCCYLPTGGSTIHSAATHCNTLQHTTTHVLQHTFWVWCAPGRRNNAIMWLCDYVLAHESFMWLCTRSWRYSHICVTW